MSKIRTGHGRLSRRSGPRTSALAPSIPLSNTPTGENDEMGNFGTSQGNVTVSDRGATGNAWDENHRLDCRLTAQTHPIPAERLITKLPTTVTAIFLAMPWSENTGWINFGFTTNRLILSGAFIRPPRGENIGWISLNCSNTTCRNG